MKAHNLGAHYIVDHAKPLQSQIEALGIGQVTHVASLKSTDSYFDIYTKQLAPFGKIPLINDPESLLDMNKLKLKSLSLHWKFIFARSVFNAVDINEQGNLLNRISDLVNQDYIQTTAGRNMGNINAENLKAAHAELESGRSIGKIALQGF